jgi:hypothetical protein
VPEERGRPAPTEREQALFNPRADKPVGSAAWCWQTIALLQGYWSHLETSSGYVEGVLRELEGARAWEVVPPEKPYGSLDALLRAEIGADRNAIRSRIDDLRAQGAKTTALHANGGDRRSPEFQIDGVNLKRDGNSADYLLARIKRDAPEVLERFVSGEFPNVRAAADVAGIPRPPARTSVSLDPERLARTLREKLTPDQIRTLIALLEAPP